MGLSNFSLEVQDSSVGINVASHEVWGSWPIILYLSRGDPLEKDMATHSSILAWRIPWAEEPGRLQSIGSQKLDRT